MRILLDTNIILDIALQREPFYDSSANVFKLIDKNKIYGFVTATTISDIYYIAKKAKNHQLAVLFLKNLISIIDILEIDFKIIENSLKSPVLDFEDAIQVEASKKNDIDYIITRNIDDFKYSNIKAVLPNVILELLKNNSK
ncbi:MAG: PIN domain-containing protein [Cytophagales bacterium]|nr:MAG: PIN domain-containing protein [Cytophagales bacterium]